MAFYLKDVRFQDIPKLRFLRVEYTYHDYGDLHNFTFRLIIAPSWCRPSSRISKGGARRRPGPLGLITGA